MNVVPRLKLTEAWAAGALCQFPKLYMGFSARHALPLRIRTEMDILDQWDGAAAWHDLNES